MRIGIDARLYGTKHGGIGRYTQKLIENLERADHENQYVVFLQKNNFDEYLSQSSNFTKVLADFRAYSWQEQILFPGFIKKYKLDLMHFTHFNVPLLYGCKFIVTIHDLIISHYPDSRATTLNPLLYKIKLFFYNLVINRAAKKAEKIIAVSQCTKKDIVKFLHIEPEKVVVTYEGCDMSKDLPTDCSKILSDMGIDGDYLLYVGSAYPHKNLELLLLAFKKVSAAGQKVKLLLVGNKNFFYQRLEAEIKKQDLQNDVILPGYLDDEKLACLYKNARAYVFPSLIEGFGLPPLEAQSYGVPVISSNATCLPEILGDSAIYFDPQNIDDMADKIALTLDGEDLRNNLVMQGYENLKRFSWQDCASKTLSSYK